MKGGYIGFDNAFVCPRCEQLYVDKRSPDEINRGYNSIQLDPEDIETLCEGCSNKSMPPEYSFTSPCEWCWRPLGQGFMWPFRERKIEAPHKTLKFCDATCRSLWREHGGSPRVER